MNMVLDSNRVADVQPISKEELDALAIKCAYLSNADLKHGTALFALVNVDTHVFALPKTNVWLSLLLKKRGLPDKESLPKDDSCEL